MKKGSSCLSFSDQSSQPLVSLWQAVLPSSVSLSSWTSTILQVCSQTAFCVFSFPVGLEKCVSEPLLCDPSFNSHVRLACGPHNSRQHVIAYEVDGNNGTSTLPSGTSVTRSETKFTILYLFEVCNEDLCLMRRQRTADAFWDCAGQINTSAESRRVTWRDLSAPITYMQ